MKNIRIEEVGDINSEFPYLEIFLKESANPFLEIGISEHKKLSFKFYASQTDIKLEVEEWEFILLSAKDFLPRTLRNENDFLNFQEQ